MECQTLRLRVWCVRARVCVFAPIPLSSVMTESFHSGWKRLPVPSLTVLEGWSVSQCVCFHTHILTRPSQNKLRKRVTLRVISF